MAKRLTNIICGSLGLAVAIWGACQLLSFPTGSTYGVFAMLLGLLIAYAAYPS